MDTKKGLTNFDTKNISSFIQAYNENHIISPKERRELRTKYIEAIFTGISVGLVYCIMSTLDIL